MRFNLLLSSACAALLLLSPAASLAQQPGGQNPADQRGDHRREGGQPGAHGPSQAHVRPQGAPTAGQAPPAGAAGQANQGQFRRSHEGQRSPFGGQATPRGPVGPAVQGQAPHPWTGQSRQGPAGQAIPGQGQRQHGSQPSDHPPGQFTPAPGQRPTGQFQHPREAQPGRPDQHIFRGARPSVVPPPLTGWDSHSRGSDQLRRGQQWRNQHRDLDRDAPWRRDRTWWRGDARFRLFTGPRLGFLFFPSFGYVVEPPQYRDHRWSAGEYLPNWFWRYTVADYWTYGLPAPPEGCAWVWLNRDVALVDLSDGYVLDIVRDVW